MSYDNVFWLVLCASLTGLGLVATVLFGRRRSARAMLHGAAWSLIPIAAWMTGATRMLWQIGVAIGRFASSFVFSPERWAGVGVVALIVALFIAAGGHRTRKKAREARAAKRKARVSRAASGGALAAPGAGPASAAALLAELGLAGGKAKGGDAAVPGKDVAVPGKNAPAGGQGSRQGPPPKAAKAGQDNDLAEIEDILRKRGILPARIW